jgi:hypothetical protein
MNMSCRARCSSLFILTTLLLLTCVAIAADPIGCPANIDVQEQLSASTSGWQTTLDDAPHLLAGLTFYDGQPQEKASLVYDSMTKAAGKQVAKWTLTPEGGRAIWVACSYSGTSVQLIKSLPTSVKSCEVTYNPREHVAGLPLIEKIACK